MLKNKGFYRIKTGHKYQDWKRILQKEIFLENKGFVGIMGPRTTMGNLVTEMVS